MAGLTKRYCRQTCECEPECEGVCDGSFSEPCTPFRNSDNVKGLCGCCQSGYYNCDENGENCGEWQCEESDTRECCDCSPTACGDGHDCPRYVDIEFDLGEFVIQGEACCNNSAPLTQQCAGAWQSEYPVVGNPSGWGGPISGETDYVVYEKTKHKIRLTRQDCGCFWGGYWSSSCDCSTCCCDDSCEEGSIYPNCNDCSYHNCFDTGCVEMPEDDCGGSACRACDPSTSCGWATDNGYASSQDTHGTGNIGGSDGQALCTNSSCRSDAGCANCGYVSSVCDSWIDQGTAAFACWNCGTFKPHHIQAWLTYTRNSTADGTAMGQCNVAWVLEIRGLTEDTAAQFGNTNNWPFFDCPGSDGTTDACAFSNGGYASDQVGYRAKFEGRNGVCSIDCDQEGGDSPVNEFIMHSCGCPPTIELESTVQVRGALTAFHPTAVFGQGLGEVIPQMHTCIVNDAQGNQPGAHWCRDSASTDPVLGLDPICTGIVKQVDGCYTTGTCYGPPLIWGDRCDYCFDCCEGNFEACSLGCTCLTGTPEEWCDCAGPNDATETGGTPNELFPCSHCCGGNENLNHPDCNPCIDPPNCQESRICAPCRLVMRPNNSETPAWSGGT